MKLSAVTACSILCCFYCFNTIAESSSPEPFAIEEPEANSSYSFPSSTITVPSGFGLGHGQLGVGLAGWDCHWGIDNCENDGALMLSYGLGDQMKNIGLTLEFSILSINPQDGGFANKGSIGFKLSHFFSKSHTGASFGIHQLTGWENNSDTTGFYRTSYFSLTHFMRLNKSTDNNGQYPLSITVGAGNRIYGQTDWVSISALPYNKWLPFVGVGYRVNPWLDLVADEYSDGVTSAGLSIKPIKAIPIRVFVGGYDLFVVEDEQERTSFLIAFTGSL
jgi:hypothetical protein